MIAHSLKGHEVTLVAEGKPQAVILISTDEEKDTDPALRQTLRTSVQNAAKELSETIAQISGASLPIERVGEQDLPLRLKSLSGEGKIPIVVGKLVFAAFFGREAAWKNSSSFLLEIGTNGIAIAGATPRATEIGVHALLEELGVRWFFPGKLGTIIPQASTVRAKAQRRLESPAFQARNFQLRDPLRWINHQKAGGAYFPGAHGIPLGDDVSFETHPEFYGLVGKERQPRQLCVSNPQVLERAVAAARAFFEKNPDAPWYGLGPNDGGGFCQCEGCRNLDAGDYDPFSGEESVTDRYIWFFNRMLEALELTHPDKKLAFYIYHTYMRPPKREKPNPKISGAIAPIALCRIHGPSNPVCPERGYLKELVAQWAEILPDLYERGYWYNLGDPAMPFVQISRMADEIPYYAARGVQGYRTECLNHWALHGPSLYLAGRLLWNPNEDVSAILNDYTTRLFGASAKPMLEYFQLVDERLTHGDHHAGSSYEFLNYFPKSVRDQGRAILEKAEALAVESPYRERVDLFKTGFEYSDAFGRMLEARNSHRWKEAADALAEVDHLRDVLTTQYEAPMLEPTSSEGHLRRFFRLGVEQGAARTQGGNTLVHPLQDEWEFLLDPTQTGGTLHYEKAELQGGNWQKVPTWTTTWSAQGLRYYRGMAWYRQSFELTESQAGKRLFLWFGGVDESARVWVNGHLVGTSPSSAFTPFEVDITDAVRAGKNVVTLCVANLRTNELGTGGITAPAFVYAPAKGADAVLENVRPLRDTFP